MSDSQFVQRIEAVFSTVMEPELHRDLMSLNMVRDLCVDEVGTVSMTVVLITPVCPLKDRIYKDIEQALIFFNGVERVEVSWDSNVIIMCGLFGCKDIFGVRNIVVVSAGKGGVGKTIVSVNTVIALSQLGACVGLLDADIYGPNIIIMLGLYEQSRSFGERILLLQVHGIAVMLLGTIFKPDQAVVWCGPMIGGALRQFFYDVDWGELDYLVIDLLFGIGDAQLTLAQSIPLTGSVIVTTLQDVSVADVSRGVQMFRQLKVSVFGVIENMSGYVCLYCGERTEIFGIGGGSEVVQRFEIFLLGQIFFDFCICIGGGDGQSLMVVLSDSPVAAVFRDVASHIAAEVSKENFRAGVSGPVMPSGPRIWLAQ